MTTRPSPKTSLPMMVALTGARGFVGGALLRHLSATGVPTRCFTRSVTSGSVGGSQWCGGRQLDADGAAALLEDVDVVINCAGNLRDPEEFKSANVELVRTLARVAGDRGIRFVQLGSLGVFAEKRSGQVTEATPLCPVGSYEESKAEADEVLLSEAAQNGLSVRILRPAAVVASEMPSPWLRSLLEFFRGRAGFLVDGGSGLLPLSPLPSTVEALTLLGSDRRGGARVYHLAQTISFEHIAKLCRRTNGCPSLPSIPEGILRVAACLVGGIPGVPLNRRRVEVFTRQVDFPQELIVREFGYVEGHPLDEFLVRLIEEWRGAK